MRWLPLACVSILAACAEPRPIDGRSAYVQGDPIEIAWLRSDVRVPEFGFHMIDGIGKLPPKVRGDLEYWNEKLLHADALPLPAREVEIYMHAATNETPDLVRFHYHYDKLDLTVDESVNFMVVWVRNVRLGKQPPEERAAIISDVANRILNMRGERHDWTFGPPQAGAKLGDDGNFTTSPSVDPDKMGSWEERADGGVMRGVLYFFLYKKNPNRAGYENGQNWFSDDVKKRL